MTRTPTKKERHSYFNKAASAAAAERQRDFKEIEAVEPPAESGAKAACPLGGSCEAAGGGKWSLLKKESHRLSFFSRDDRIRTDDLFNVTEAL